jgi:hypothetical protein
MVIKYNNFSIPRPSKLYSNLDFWFEKNHLATLGTYIAVKRQGCQIFLGYEIYKKATKYTK